MGGSWAEAERSQEPESRSQEARRPGGEPLLSRGRSVVLPRAAPENVSWGAMSQRIPERFFSGAWSGL